MSGKDEQLTGQLAVVGLFMVTPAALALMFATSRLGAAAIPIWIAFGGAAWLISKGSIGDAIARRLQGGAAEGSDHEELHQDMDDLRAQVGELQERVDFTERLLAREREIRPLPSGDHQ